MIGMPKFDQWLSGREDEHLEFKEAKNRFDFEELARYCAALANEGGGKMILGVTDAVPRKVVGSNAFRDLERTKGALVERLHLRIDGEQIDHPDGRVVVFHVPPRPLGFPIQYKGAYWMRAGESLVPMTPDLLKRIFNEGQPDFSAEVIPTANIADLDPAAITEFRRRWQRKSGDDSLTTKTDEQILHDAELLIDGGITYAALILFGSSRAMGRYLAQAEVIFEYRSDEASITSQQRKEFRQGFFLYFDELWNLVNLRNDIQHYQDGLFIWDIPTFNEEVVREAILNAVCHRDYRLAGSVFLRQFPRKLEVISPGGFPDGINVENLLYRQSPRNRRLAEALARCGLVERSGQGFDRIFTQCIRETKPLPDFSWTDNFYVHLTLHGTVQDLAFLRFLEKIRAETQRSFTVEDFLVLDLIKRGQAIPPRLMERLPRLRDAGVVESVGRGRGIKYILSKRLYSMKGERGAYTRVRGLDREHKKALILQHLENYGRGKMEEFQQLLPSLDRHQILKLLSQLRTEGKVRFVGPRKTGHWELLQPKCFF